MKKRNWLSLVALTLCLTACYPTSINPFYKPKDISFDPHLLGEWRPAEESDTELWTFTADKTNAYQLTITSKDRAGEFAAVLFKIGNERYLDLIASKCEFATNQYDGVNESMVPSHLLFHVVQTEPEFKFALYDPEWIYNYLTNSPKAIAHTMQDKCVIFTAETKDLQRFVAKHREFMFTNYTAFVRPSAVKAEVVPEVKK